MSTPPPPSPVNPTAETPVADPITPGTALPDAVAELDPQAQARYEQVRRLSHVLDSQFPLPGTDWRFGVDAVVGLIPGVGGIAGLALSSVVIAQGIAIGARGATVVRMLMNAGFDAALNAIPVLGWVSDLFFKANERNVRLLSTLALDPDRTREDSRRMVVTTVLAIVVAALLLAGVAAAVVVGLLTWLF